MPDYKVIDNVTALPPTSGIEDVQVRTFLDSVKSLLDERSGLGPTKTDHRFVTAGEFTTMANKAIVDAFTPGSPGGADSIKQQPSAAAVHRIIDNLADTIRQSILYQKLEIALNPDELADINRNIDTAVATARAGVVQETKIRTQQDLALASAVNNIWAQIGGTTAVIDDGAMAISVPSAAQATKWTSVVAAVTDPNTGLVNSTSIKQQLTSYANKANGAFNSIYSVRAQLSVSGQTIVGGFGLSASTNLGDISGPDTPGSTIDFGVRADRFFIAATSNTPDAATQIGMGSSIPFMALTTSQVVNGQLYPPGVYIKRAVIGNATIGTAQIDDAAINTAKIGDAQITTAKIGDLAVDTLKIAGNAVTIPVGARLLMDTDATDTTGYGLPVLSLTVSGTGGQPVWVHVSAAVLSFSGAATDFFAMPVVSLVVNGTSVAHEYHYNTPDPPSPYTPLYYNNITQQSQVDLVQQYTTSVRLVGGYYMASTPTTPFTVQLTIGGRVTVKAGSSLFAICCKR